MSYQVYIDESDDGTANPQFCVLAALASPADKWKCFSEEWVECLADYPVPVHCFKYAKFKKRMSPEKRLKLKRLAALVNRYVECVSPIAVDFKQYRALTDIVRDRDIRSPYFMAATYLLDKTSRHLAGNGVASEVEVIFDENHIWLPRFTPHYPSLRQLIGAHPSHRCVLPSNLATGRDELNMPIQAADLIVGLVRESIEQPDSELSRWLLTRLSNVDLPRELVVVDGEFLGALYPEMVAIAAGAG